MDNQTRDPQVNEVLMLDSNSVPLYDRGYAFGLTPSDGSVNLERYLTIIFVGFVVSALNKLMTIFLQ